MIISLCREIFFAYMILFSKFSIDILSRKRDTIFTTNGEGEHARHTSRKVARKPREKEAGLGGMKAVTIRWAEQEAARKARKRPVILVRRRSSRAGMMAERPIAAVKTVEG